jgi:hypothetical protein
MQAWQHKHKNKKQIHMHALAKSRSHDFSFERQNAIPVTDHSATLVGCGFNYNF